jgi:hypothetical protein
MRPEYGPPAVESSGIADGIGRGVGAEGGFGLPQQGKTQQAINSASRNADCRAGLRFDFGELSRAEVWGLRIEP